MMNSASPESPAAVVTARLNHASAVALCFGLIVASWFGMQAVHECGHVLAGWMTGARVIRVVLHPLTISRTDIADNPRPGIVAWGGPVWGVIAPLAVWGIAVGIRASDATLLRFFAGFCLVANGAYLGFGSLEGIGDCGTILLHGSPMWSLWMFAGATIPAGLWLWHGESRQFGWGTNARPVSWRTVFLVYGVTLMLIVSGCFTGS